jgi:hypothetical protein
MIYKEFILKQQNFKCANSPYNPALNLIDYNCYLWIYNNGYFDEAGYIINHINEFNLSIDNSITNLQALCPNCYAVKVKRFNKHNKYFTTSQLAIGRQFMDTSD